MKYGLLRTLALEENGLETIEYAVIAGLIVVGAITAIAAIAVWLGNQYTSLKTKLGA
jgi:Flp pilus assembly pilin Flp